MILSIRENAGLKCMHFLVYDTSWCASFLRKKCIRFAYFISLSSMVAVVVVEATLSFLLELTGCKDVD